MGERAYYEEGRSIGNRCGREYMRRQNLVETTMYQADPGKTLEPEEDDIYTPLNNYKLQNIDYY